MNMALDGETPYDNANLFGFLMKHMAVMESTTTIRSKYWVGGGLGWENAVFYTTDGMRFEIRNGSTQIEHKLYESDTFLCLQNAANPDDKNGACGGCGSMGLNNNTDNTTKPPCLIMVDVNGDRKPNPKNASCLNASCKDANKYKFSDPDGKKLTDMFTIMITDKEAIPYGVAAQKAMYQSQK